ncbi:MAG: hypothetical protein WBC44_22620 [Planctomycetaceae bacterium]
MSLPLIAVPCLAVFGLPSIGPATAGAETEETVELAIDGDLGAASTTLGTPTNSAAFSPIVDAGQPASAPDATPFQPAPSDQSEIARTSGHREAAANMAIGLNESANVHREIAPSAGTNNGSPAAFGLNAETAAHGNTGLSQNEEAPKGSWEQVLDRLNQLGIRGFHLTNSDVPGKFYFSCNMAEDGRNVTRRFEAEAATPVAAADDVLRQVQACMATR